VKAITAALSAGLLFLGACAGQNRPQAEPGAQGVGAPRPAADPELADGARPTPREATEREPIRMPDRITLPASYRLLLVDGHLALVHETDSQALEPPPTSMRIVMGEIARGEIAYQPALLPQELAEQVASNRESSARMDNALETVMQRSRELSDQALELEAQGKKLAELLAAAQARVRELEAAPAAGPAKPPQAKADPGGPPQ
jgi:hypothetical protein